MGPARAADNDTASRATPQQVHSFRAPCRQPITLKNESVALSILTRRGHGRRPSRQGLAAASRPWRPGRRLALARRREVGPYGTSPRGRAGEPHGNGHRPLLRLPEPRRPGRRARPGRGRGLLPSLLGADGTRFRSLHRCGAVEVVAMRAASSRFIAVWASHEARARIWFRLFVVTLACLVLSLFTTIRVWTRPREVIRIGCDGIPQVVTLDNAVVLGAERAGDPRVRHRVRGVLRAQRLVLHPQRPRLVRQPDGARAARALQEDGPRHDRRRPASCPSSSGSSGGRRSIRPASTSRSTRSRTPGRSR